MSSSCASRRIRAIGKTILYKYFQIRNLMPSHTLQFMSFQKDKSSRNSLQYLYFKFWIRAPGTHYSNNVIHIILLLLSTISLQTKYNDLQFQIRIRAPGLNYITRTSRESLELQVYTSVHLLLDWDYSSRYIIQYVYFQSSRYARMGEPSFTVIKHLL